MTHLSFVFLVHYLVCKYSMYCLVNSAVRIQIKKYKPLSAAFTKFYMCRNAQMMMSHWIYVTPSLISPGFSSIRVFCPQL